MTNRLPEPGELFGGKHKLNEVLGEGGFGRVYRATRIDIGRVDAIKILLPDRDSATDSARFLREARVLAGLNNVHTITLHDFGETQDGLLFMIFEFVEGQTLSEVIKTQGSVAPDTVEHIIRQLLESLDEAHAAGIVHRDIKPDNVMIHPRGEDPFGVKLLDFGIAKSYADPNGIEVTANHEVIGTARYMAPEQFFGEPSTPASDMYSLGLVAFEMLTGSPAFGEKKVSEVRRAQMSVDSRTLPATLDVPAPLRALVDACLRKVADKRPQSVGEAVAILDGQPTDAHSTDGASDERAWPVTAIVVGTVALVAVLGIVVANLTSDSRSASKRATAPDVSADVDGYIDVDHDVGHDATASRTTDASDSRDGTDITLLMGQPILIPRDDITRIEVDDGSVVGVRRMENRPYLYGIEPGRTPVTLLGEGEPEQIIVDVVAPGQSDVDEKFAPITMFLGGQMEFEHADVQSISVGLAKVIKVSVSEDKARIILTAAALGKTAVSLTGPRGTETFVVEVVPVPGSR